MNSSSTLLPLLPFLLFSLRFKPSALFLFSFLFFPFFPLFSLLPPYNSSSLFIPFLLLSLSPFPLLPFFLYPSLPLSLSSCLPVSRTPLLSCSLVPFFHFPFVFSLSPFSCILSLFISFSLYLCSWYFWIPSPSSYLPFSLSVILPFYLTSFLCRWLQLAQLAKGKKSRP